MAAEATPRALTLVRLSNSDSWCIAAGDVEARPEGMVDVASGIIVVESVPVIEREPVLDLLEQIAPLILKRVEGERAPCPCKNCTALRQIEALLRTHGRLKGDDT
jgi:hypothetical protein